MIIFDETTTLKCVIEEIKQMLDNGIHAGFDIRVCYNDDTISPATNMIFTWHLDMPDDASNEEISDILYRSIIGCTFYEDGDTLPDHMIIQAPEPVMSENIRNIGGDINVEPVGSPY